jgi:glycosyltransferase involved in cell wall biosynthesis
VVSKSGLMLMVAATVNKASRESKITVLMISHEGSMTGAPLFLERLAGGLSKSTYRVVIFFSRGGPIVARMRADGFEIYCSEKRPGTSGKLISLSYRVIHYFRFLRALWIVKPDIVYSNTIVNCGETVLSRMCGFATLVHMHEGMNFAAKLKRRLAIETSVCNDVLVGSEYAGRALYSLTGNVGTVVPIGVSGISVSDTAHSPRSSTLRIGILGTVDKNKGQLVALNALALVIARGMDVQLIVAGAEVDSSYSLKLRNFVVENKLENRVVFLGMIDSIDSFFLSIDVLLVCSYDEVFPTVILEAMRERKLVVATRVGGIPEIIEHGSTGFLYEAGNVEELSQRFMDTLGNQDFISGMVERAHMKFSESYELSNSVDAISKRFSLILKK